MVNGKVVVNLVGVVREVVVNLAAQLPTIFGTTIADKIPDNVPVDQIRGLLSQYLGIELPPGFAQVPIMDASALESARTGVKVVNLSVVLVEVLALLSLVLAIVVSVRRRRTILQIGLWTAGITALVFFSVRAVTTATLNGLTDSTLKPAAVAAVHEIFSSLRGWLGPGVGGRATGPGRVAGGRRRRRGHLAVPLRQLARPRRCRSSPRPVRGGRYALGKQHTRPAVGGHDHRRRLAVAVRNHGPTSS